MTDHTWDDHDPEDEQFPSDLDALGFDDDQQSHDHHEDDWSGPDAFTTAEQRPSGLDALDFGDNRHLHQEHGDVWSGPDAFPGDETLSAPTADGSAPTLTDYDDSDDESSGPVTFGVTNPAGTITAQATISGAINRIELSPSITSMTESDLAHDIMATARLANLQGRAIQRAMVQSLLMHQGIDQDVAAQYIDDISDLPTPAQAEAAQVEAMAEYLRGER
ncbi:hypothetical protein [Mycobacterium sp. NPDC004974]